MEGFTQTQVSTLAVKDNLLVAGGFQGELICKVSQSSIFVFDKNNTILFLSTSEDTKGGVGHKASP